MLYFGFQLYGINTRYLVTALLFLTCMLVTRYRRRCLTFLSKTPARYVNIIFAYNVITLFWTLLLLEFDFGMFIGTFRLVVISLDMIMLWAILPRIYRPYHLQLMVSIFILQSIIIFLAFLSPSFLDIIRTFQYDNIMEVADQYLDHGTFRGLALSGDQFYGLTASFGLISIIVMKLYVDTSRHLWIGVFIILFAANMFVGRTGFVGFAAAFAYLFVCKNNGRFKLILKVCLFTILTIGVIYLLLPQTIKDILDESVFAYAFQIFYNYNDSGSFSTSSSDRVAEMWQLDISFLTMLVGDGRVTNANGSYYGNVDVGYLRQILYGGIFYLLLSIYMTYKILMNYKNIYIHRGFRIKINVSRYKFEIIVFLYLLVTHAKGLSFMYCPEIMMIILYYFYHQNYKSFNCIR